MAKSKFGAKIAFGDVERLQQALDDGVLDERDLVISNLRSLPSLFVIDDDKNIKKLRSYIDVFETVEEANTWLNSIHTNVLDGQPIAILDGNKERYNLYLVRIYNGTYGLNPVSSYAQIDKLEEHINDTNNPHKTTYEQVGLTPMTDSEIREIVDKVFSK